MDSSTTHRVRAPETPSDGFLASISRTQCGVLLSIAFTIATALSALIAMPAAYTSITLGPRCDRARIRPAFLDWRQPRRRWTLNRSRFANLLLRQGHPSVLQTHSSKAETFHPPVVYLRPALKRQKLFRLAFEPLHQSAVRIFGGVRLPID